MATIRHFEGIDYTLTMKKLVSSQGYDRSIVEAKDLTGKVFETWHRRYRLWRHPIHGKARSIAEIKEIYNAIDIDDYVKKSGYITD